MERSEPSKLAPQGASAVSRRCGSCTACCTVMSVSDIDNAPGCRCFHECDRGCAIYESRPEGCRGFTCLWLADVRGRFGPEYRPDRFGLVLTDDAEEMGPEPAIAAREVWAGAASKPQAHQLLSLLGSLMSVRVIPAPPGKPVPLTVNGESFCDFHAAA